MVKVRVAPVFATLLAAILAVEQYQPVQAASPESGGYKVLRERRPDTVPGRAGKRENAAPGSVFDAR
jgi:hypothetical protein